MAKNWLLLVLFGIFTAISIAGFLRLSTDPLTLVNGIGVGVGLTGMTRSALALLWPGKYRFVYEMEESENT